MLTAFALAAAIAVVAVALFFWMAGERSGYHRSTWQLFREAGFGLNSLHSYVYGRWPYRYIKTLFSLPDPSSSRQAQKTAHWLSDHYHGKVLSHDHAKEVVKLNRKVPMQDLEQVVPYPLARKIVLNGPPDVVVFDCPCRLSRDSHCEPTQVCMVVGKPFTDFILEHHPGNAKRLTQTKALELLEAEHQRGHLHSAWFKDAMLDRFYAICNCCKCCCGGIQMMKKGVPMLASSGYVAEIDSDLCAGCDDCMEACPFDALTKNGDGVARNWDLCMGCGVCETACSTGAISMVPDERKGIPLDVRALA